MPLEPGTKLGPYEILAPIGAGGMGEVYKATDTRLNRTVAIKVLPPHFTDNLEMKQRFDREAQVIAGLSHPHICTLYDVGRQGPSTGSGQAIDFLVMEHLEGETLASRIERGALPLDEALKVAIAIADALDKAHGQGRHAPRPEARQCDADGKWGQAARLRPRKTEAVAPGLRCCIDVRGPHQHDHAGHDPRHHAVHGPGAARRQGGRRPYRHLCLRRRPV